MPVKPEQESPKLTYTQSQQVRKHEQSSPETSKGAIADRKKVLNEVDVNHAGSHTISEEGGASGRRRKVVMDKSRASHDQPHTIITDDGEVTKSKRRPAFARS